MALVFEDTFSTNDTSKWSSEVDVSGIGTAASGAYVCTFAGSTPNAYLTQDVVVPDGAQCAYFEFDATFSTNKISNNASSDNWRALELLNGATTQVLALQFQTVAAGGGYATGEIGKLVLRHREKDGGIKSTLVDNLPVGTFPPDDSNNDFTIKVFYAAGIATVDGDDNGVIKVWVNDVLVSDHTDIANAGQSFTKVWWGHVEVSTLTNTTLVTTYDNFKLASNLDVTTAAGSADYYIDSENGDDLNAGTSALPQKTALSFHSWAQTGDEAVIASNSRIATMGILEPLNSGSGGIITVRGNSNFSRASITGTHDWTGTGVASGDEFRFGAASSVNWMPINPGIIYVGLQSEWLTNGWSALRKIDTLGTIGSLVAGEEYGWNSSIDVIQYRPDSSRGETDSNIHIEIPTPHAADNGTVSLGSNNMIETTADNILWQWLSIENAIGQCIKLLTSCAGTEVLQCTVRESGRDTVSGLINISAATPNIISCLVYNNRGSLANIHMGGGGDSDVIGCTIYNGYNDLMAIVNGNMNIYGNSLFNTGLEGISDNSAINVKSGHTATISLNTIVGCTEGLRLEETTVAGNVTATENIIAYCTRGVNTTALDMSASLTNLTYFGNTANEVTSTASNTRTTDPQFNSVDTTVGYVSGGRSSADHTLKSTSPEIGGGSKTWANANHVGADGEPFSDSYTDRGGYQSIFGPFHPVNL